MRNIDVIRDRLLCLHRIVLDEARAELERDHGKKTAGELLGVLVNHRDFAWLRPFTSLIIELDDEERDDATWTTRARALLRPDAEGNDFQRRYDDLVQRSPDIVVAHGAAMHALG